MTKKTSRRSGAVTTRDIAERTGLSKMTVSRVLNHHPYVSEETRRSVLQAVKDLGFRPNTLAKRFFTGRTRLIGVVIPLEYIFSSFYFTELFRGVLECAEERGYDVLLNDSTSKRKPPVEKCLDLVQGKLAEGLLLAAPMAYDDYPLKLVREGVTLVLTGESACGGKVHRVTIPNGASARDAVLRLTRLGHRRIALLTFDPTHRESEVRLAGCREGLAAAGLAFDPALVFPARYNRREAFRLIRGLLSKQKDVTAVLALNADMALGAADAIRESGLRIPEDLSVVSFDDCAEIEDYEPPVSAVRQFPYKVGYQACDLLVGLLSGEAKPRKPQTRMVETQFMERRSVAPPPKARRA